MVGSDSVALVARPAPVMPCTIAAASSPARKGSSPAAAVQLPQQRRQSAGTLSALLCNLVCLWKNESHPIHVIDGGGWGGQCDSVEAGGCGLPISSSDRPQRGSRASPQTGDQHCTAGGPTIQRLEPRLERGRFRTPRLEKQQTAVRATQAQPANEWELPQHWEPKHGSHGRDSESASNLRTSAVPPARASVAMASPIMPSSSRSKVAAIVYGDGKIVCQSPWGMGGVALYVAQADGHVSGKNACSCSGARQVAVARRERMRQQQRWWRRQRRRLQQPVSPSLCAGTQRRLVRRARAANPQEPCPKRGELQ